MIRNVLLPESYNGYYLFQTRIVGIHIAHSALYATIIVARGRALTIEQYMYEPLEVSLELSFQERAGAAIARLKDRIGVYDRMHIAVPSADGIYKELTLPFSDQNKIEMVAPFEIEDSLPFSLDEAVIATVATQSLQEETHVMCVVYRRSTIDAYLAPFEEQGLLPDVITSDAMAYYLAFSHVRSFRQEEHVVSYLDIDLNESRMWVLDHGRFRLVRTLRHGVQSICDITADSYQELKQVVQACGMTREEIQKSPLYRDIQFTIAAANRMLGPEKQVSHVIITGLGSEASHIADAFTATLSLPASIMNANMPLRMEHISTQTNTHVPAAFITSVATALPQPQNKTCQITRGTVTKREEVLRFKQIGVATGLTILFFASFLAYSIYRSHVLQDELDRRNEETLAKLTKTFDLSKQQRQKGIDTLIKNSIPNRLSQEETLWFSLSQRRTFSFLYYLQELSTHIDRKQLGLDLKKLEMRRDSKTGKETIKIDVSVADYNALRVLRESLKNTKLFASVPRFQELSFEETLTIEQPGEAS